MWQRADLKRRAKDVLRTKYWMVFLISLVISFVSGGSGGVGGSFQLRSGRNDDWYKKLADFNFDWPAVIAIASVIGIVILVSVLVGTAIRIFVYYPLEVGGRRFMIQTAEGTEAAGYFSFPFRSDNYWGTVGSMLLKDVQIFLWTLLFIIPGIIKTYEYYMVPYILAQNPRIGAKRAIELSRQMTYGSKFDIFILELSFIGWYLLGILACCIGVIFVAPYVNMTKAELYLDLRKAAIERGQTTPGELAILP